MSSAAYTYEVRPCKVYGPEVTQCAPEEAQFWGLYKRPAEPDSNSQQLGDWVADFPTEHAASAAASAASQA